MHLILPNANCLSLLWHMASFNSNSACEEDTRTHNMGLRVSSLCVQNRNFDEVNGVDNLQLLLTLKKGKRP